MKLLIFCLSGVSCLVVYKTRKEMKLHVIMTRRKINPNKGQIFLSNMPALVDMNSAVDVDVGDDDDDNDDC